MSYAKPWPTRERDLSYLTGSGADAVRTIGELTDGCSSIDISGYTYLDDNLFPVMVDVLRNYNAGFRFTGLCTFVHHKHYLTRFEVFTIHIESGCGDYMYDAIKNDYSRKVLLDPSAETVIALCDNLCPDDRYVIVIRENDSLEGNRIIAPPERALVDWYVETERHGVPFIMGRGYLLADLVADGIADIGGVRAEAKRLGPDILKMVEADYAECGYSLGKR